MRMPLQVFMSPQSLSEARLIQVALHLGAWLFAGCRPESTRWVGVVISLTLALRVRHR